MLKEKKSHLEANSFLQELTPVRKGGKVRTIELFLQKVDPFTLNLRVCLFNKWINLCNFSTMTADV